MLLLLLLLLLFTPSLPHPCSTPGDGSTFDGMTGPGLHQVVNAMYKETSKHLLEVLNTKYLFLDHLKVGGVVVCAVLVFV